MFCLRVSDYQLVMKVSRSDTSREYRVMLRGFVWQDTLELREDICCMWRFPKNNGTTEGFQRGYFRERLMVDGLAPSSPRGEYTVEATLLSLCEARSQTQRECRVYMEIRIIKRIAAYFHTIRFVILGISASHSPFDRQRH